MRNYALLTNLNFNKIKKIILSIVFVFASLAMVNANSKVEDQVDLKSVFIDNSKELESMQASHESNVDCIELAFRVDSLTPGGISYDMFITIWWSCEEQKK